MLTGDDLKRALSTIATTSYNGYLYRTFVTAGLKQIANPDVFYTLRSTMSGARFTESKNGQPSIYLAQEEMTGVIEVTQDAIRVRANKPDTTTFRVKVKLSRVLDTTDPAVQQQLQTSVDELTSAWRPYQWNGSIAPTQLLGSAVYATERVQAIRYTSAARYHLKEDLTEKEDGVCFVIFPDRLVSKNEDFIEVVDAAPNYLKRIPPRELSQ